MTVERDVPLALVGCDVVSVQRIADTLARREHFRSRVFTPRELADARRGGVAKGTIVEHERLAVRFAAKEAARKALGDLTLGFHDTEVRTDASGAPALYVRGQRSPLQLSLSHDGGVAFAVVAGPSSTERPAAEEEPDCT
ncbi:MAG TPA: holo-ACP synthase [Nitriliruptorales bacterium]